MLSVLTRNHPRYVQSTLKRIVLLHSTYFVEIIYIERERERERERRDKSGQLKKETERVLGGAGNVNVSLHPTVLPTFFTSNLFIGFP